MKMEQAITQAMDALQNSYAPYSHFHVAAALVTKNGNCYTGVNIENASYPATNCAERTAFFKAVSVGEREFSYIVIVGGKEGKVTAYCPPCGVCRQVMREFCNPKDFKIVLATSTTDYKEYTLEEMLPLGFGPDSLI